MYKLRARLLALAALAATATSATAGLQPMSVTVTPEMDGYRYSYGVVLTSDSKFNPGDFFTIFDFKGYVPGTATAPAGFSFSSADSGGNPIQIGAVDDPTVPNLSWTYNGSGSINGPVRVGDFSVVSTLPSGPQAVDFAALTHTATTTLTRVSRPPSGRRPRMPPS